MRMIIILISLGIVAWLIYTYSMSRPVSFSGKEPAQNAGEVVDQARETARDIEQGLQQRKEMLEKRSGQ